MATNQPKSTIKQQSPVNWAASNSGGRSSTLTSLGEKEAQQSDDTEIEIELEKEVESVAVRIFTSSHDSCWNTICS